MKKVFELIANHTRSFRKKFPLLNIHLIFTGPASLPNILYRILFPYHKYNKISGVKSLVSVIIPSYNYSDYIEDAVKSVINQAYTSFEIIIIDDRSTDGSWDIIKRLRETYGKKHTVKIRQKETNTGVVDTLNEALTLCAGEYILYLCADDYLHRDYLKLTLGVFEKEPDVAVVYTDCHHVNKDKKRIRRGFFETYSYKKLLKRNFICATSLFSAKHAEGLKFPDRIEENGRRYPEDYLFWLELLKRKDSNGNFLKAFYYPLPLFYYRWHGRNDTGDSAPENQGVLAKINEYLL